MEYLVLNEWYFEFIHVYTPYSSLSLSLSLILALSSCVVWFYLMITLLWDDSNKGYNFNRPQKHIHEGTPVSVIISLYLSPSLDACVIIAPFWEWSVINAQSIDWSQTILLCNGLLHWPGSYSPTLPDTIHSLFYTHNCRLMVWPQS